ncbi:hypothetical protein [Streptomyces sp. NRRL B-1347]|uniref:hypothetical protein n=1 Tax=Streptomyces sp. NRRL B-1347 TaxID=1476877 RepID=UPI00131D9D88|nr:hypothetical protein [Streptomyces sp. NRRL B-1347]
MRVRTASGAAGAVFFSLALGFASASPAAAVTYERNNATYHRGEDPRYTSSGWWWQGAGKFGHAGGVGAFQADGDKFWIADTARDGYSVAIRWTNYRNGSPYREGVCVNKHGAGTWAYCGKDFYENSTLWVKTCTYRAKKKKFVECNMLGSEFRVSNGKVV